MIDNDVALSFDKVRFAYKKSQEPLLDIDSWQIKRGQHIFVSGKSGSGKSTLLNLICGTLIPDSGQITVLEQPFSMLPSHKRDAFRGQHIGVVFQQFNLIPYLTVRQNIAAAAYFGKRQLNDLDSNIEHFIETLHLPIACLDVRSDELSVGQQQRVAIARALINQPELLVVDEPTSALDSDARDGFMQLLFDCVRNTQCTLLFVSHDKSLSRYFKDCIDIHSLTTAAQAS